MIFGILEILFFAILLGIIARKIGDRDPQPRQVPPLPPVVATPSSRPTIGSYGGGYANGLPDQFYWVDEPRGRMIWFYNQDFARRHFVEMHPYAQC